MRCLGCGLPDTGVLETRADGPGIRRRRRCSGCGARFNTRELPEGTLRTALPLGLVIHPPVIGTGDRGSAVIERGRVRVQVSARVSEAISLLAAAWPRAISKEEVRVKLFGRRPMSKTALNNVLMGRDITPHLTQLGLCVMVSRRVGYSLALVK